MPIVLRCMGTQRIRKTRDVNKELPRLFLDFLKAHSVEGQVTDWKTLEYSGRTFEGRPASRKYLVVQLYSLAIPSAIEFGLVSQQGPEEMLTFFGRKLLTSLGEKPEAQISHSDSSRLVLKKTILWQDKRWKIIEALRGRRNGTTLEGLIADLSAMGIVVPVNVGLIKRKAKAEITRGLREKGKLKTVFDRLRFDPVIAKQVDEEVAIRKRTAMRASLRNLLSIYENLGMVTLDEGRVMLKEDEVRRIEETQLWANSKKIPDETFFEAVKVVYDQTKRDRKVVSIPRLRDLACEKLDIPWEEFDARLARLGYSYGGYRVALSRGIYRKKWGIDINRVNYYYVSILPQRG